MSDGQPAGPGIATLRAERARWEFAERGVRRVGAVLFMGLFTVVELWGPQEPRPGVAGRSLVVLALMAVVLLAFAAVHVSLRGPGGPGMAATGLLIAGSAALIWVQPAGPGIVAVFTGVLFSALRLPWRWAAGWSAVSFAVLVAIAAVTQPSPPGTAASLAFLGGFFGVAYYARRLSDATGLAEQLLGELERSRAAQATAAGLAERQRMAREMHDVLAHTLSGLLLQLEGARMAAARDPAADPQIGEAIDRAQLLGKAGLDEARQAIGMLRGHELRGGELPGPDRLPGLATRFGRERGIPVQLTVSGTERQLSADARLAVYRVAQEALTNIAKHASAERAEVRLAYLPDAIRLAVEDFAAAGAAADVTGGAPDPVPADPVPDPAWGGGHGLTGMRERAELLGGALRAGPTGTGFLVELELPE